MSLVSGLPKQYRCIKIGLYKDCCGHCECNTFETEKNAGPARDFPFAALQGVGTANHANQLHRKQNLDKE